MRILQVANGYPHRAYGGVELHTHQLCAALARRGHELFVLTRHSDTSAADGTIVDEEVDGIPVRSVVNDFKGCRFVDHYRSQAVRAVFERTLDEVRPGVVHFQHLIGLSCDLPAVARARGLRVVGSLHDYWYPCQRVMLQHADGSCCGGPATASCIACVMGTGGRPSAPSSWDRLWCRLRAFAGDAPAAGPAENRERFRALQSALDSYDRVLTVSRYVIEEYARQGMALRHALALPLGVDRDAFGAPKDVPPLPISEQRPLRLAFVGQLLLHKGPQVLLEALRRVPELPIRLELHGRRWLDHADEAVLGPLLLAEPRATYRGRFADGGLPALLAEIDVLVVPSTCPETFGLATREAHLAGRPVLSSDRGALPESVRDGEDGLIVPGDDPEAMAHALRRLVTEPGLLERLLAGARRARDRVKSMDVYAAEVERELYVD